MKNIIIISFLTLLGFAAVAQNDGMRDNLWLFGYDTNPTDTNFGGSNIDFSVSPPDVYYVPRAMDIQETNASMCDEQGHLLFYTNGIYIANKNNLTMWNGDGLSPAGLNSEWNDVGLLLPQGALALPVPDNDSLYILVHAAYDLINFPNTEGVVIVLYYSLINMAKNNGLGAVVEKNTIISQDTFSLGQITTTRHGNGRDWWILVNERKSNRYHRWLLTPEGLVDEGVQAIGEPVENGLGQAVFSPDGTHYASINLVGTIWGNEIDLYDFDRCTGLLSNQMQLFYPDTAYSGGIAFSPNSRFLYASMYLNVYQFDLDAPDLAASRDTVATYDGFVDPFYTTFYLAQLAPDGKIYINSPNGSKWLHVIHNPDLKGDSCNFEQHGMGLPTYNSYSLPNFPNFRLGKLEGSPCDTIVASDVEAVQLFSKIFVYPNPASDRIQLSSMSYNSPNLHFKLFDVTGKLLDKASLTANAEMSLDVSGLTPGMYFYTVTTQGEVLKAGKLVIAR